MNSFPEIIVKDVKVIDFDDVDYTDDTYYSTYHKLKSYNKKKNYQRWVQKIMKVLKDIKNI